MGTPPDTDASPRGRGARLPRLGKERDPEGRMPLMEHIRELRNRLIKVVLAVIAGMVVGWLVCCVSGCGAGVTGGWGAGGC